MQVRHTYLPPDVLPGLSKNILTPKVWKGKMIMMHLGM